MTHPDLYAQLRLFLDGNEITEPSSDLLTDQRRRFTSSPDIVLQPRSVESVQNIMRFCFKHKIPVTPQGGNTGLCGAAVAENYLLLNQVWLCAISGAGVGLMTGTALDAAHALAPKISNGFIKGVAKRFLNYEDKE